MEVRTHTLGLTRIVTAAFGAVLALLFLLMLLGGAHTQAAPAQNEGTGTDPCTQAITITSELPILDTHPGDGISKTVYFNNSTPGVLTLTFEISGTPTLTLTDGAAFGYLTRTYTSSTIPWVQVITYSVETGGGDYPGVTYVATNTNSAQSTVAITYVRDIAVPTVVSPSVVETSNYVYAVGTAFYYTNTMSLEQTVAVQGYSADAASGVERVHFSPAFGDSPGDDVSGFYPWRSAAYTIEPAETAVGTITATVRDHVGNTAVQTYTYDLDGTPPTVTVDTPSVWQGLSPIPVAWRAGDAQSGVARTRLYYRCVPTDTEWQDSGLEQAGFSGTFHFTPSSYLTYTFAARATDNVGNSSALPVTGKQVVVKPVRIYLPLVVRNHPPLWQQAGGTDGISFYDIAICPSDPLIQYAGTTSEGVYYSTDGGETWQHWALDGWATPVVVNPLNCAEAFVAVWGSGIHRVTGQGQTAPVNQGLGELHLYGLAIAADGQTLYAGSSSHGVYKTDTSNINWAPVNNGIPPDDLRIRSLYIISDTLYAGGRQCTYYHSSDWGDSWQAKTVLSGGQGGTCGDAQVWAIAQMNNVLYTGLGGDKGLYQSADGGVNWTLVSDVPPVNIYRFGLYPYQSRLYVGTFGNGVYTCESDGRCMPLPNGGLGTSHVRGLEVAEIAGDYPRLLAGSDDGIWWVPLTP